MIHVSIRKNIRGQKLKDLLSFACRNSDKISIAKYYHGNLTLQEFDQIQDEFKRVILENDKENRLNYQENKNGYRDKLHERSVISTKEDADKYFNDALEQEIEILNGLKYEHFINKKNERYHGNKKDYIHSRFTRITPVTMGPVFEVCYFSIGDTFKEIVTNLNNLYEYPYSIETFEFEDLCFYKEEREILAICSHEGFAYMVLEDGEYKEFSELHVLHKKVTDCS